MTLKILELIQYLPQFSLTGISGTFTKGEKITGGTSGATATIVNPTSPITFITTNNKDFTANETITGASSQLQL